MKNKIGIATFHWGTNYGCALQGFALQKTLETLGFYAEFVDYVHTDNPTNAKKRFPLSRLTSRKGRKFFREKLEDLFVKKFFSNVSKNIYEKNQKFSFFYNSVCKRSRKYATYQDLINNEKLDYAACIVGSDQVWNPNSQRDAYYMLDFVPPEKRIAYAPSFAVSFLQEQYLNYYRNGLKQFAFLSVRERAGKALAESLVQRPVEHVLDPTFLLTQNEWNEVVKNNATPSLVSNDSYTLCYGLGRLKQCLYVAQKLKSKKIVVICVKPSDYLLCLKKNIVPIWNAGPLDFIDLVKNAGTVVTDSFHGTAFAIINRKPFWCVDRDDSSQTYTSMNSRLSNLFELFHLDDRHIDNIKSFDDVGRELDYRPVDKILEIERNRSLDFLYRALEATTEISITRGTKRAESL